MYNKIVTLSESSDRGLPPVHPGSFRHDLFHVTQLPEQWQDLYNSLVMTAEAQVRMLFGATILHSMLIERAAYLFVLQKMKDEAGADKDPEEQASYNAVMRQWLKITDQLAKYELPQMINPESAFIYTVTEIINKEVADPGTKRRIAEQLMALRSR